MTRIFICVLVVCCLVLCGCSAKKSSVDLSESTNKPNVTTAAPKEDTLRKYIEERESTGYTDFGSNTYWSDIIKKKKKEIDYIVNWFKNISYCESLSFSDGDVVTFPDNKEVREKIQTEKNFKKIKELITINKYDIRNNWFKDNEIIILHRFELEEIIGNYCLIYVEGKSKKLKKLGKYYKKIDDNYYSYVIFYE